MIHVLVLSNCAVSLLLLEDTVVHCVRNFLVNTYAVPHLLLVNAVTEEAEAGALSSIQIFCGFVILTQSCCKILQSLVLMILVADVSWSLAHNRLKTIDAAAVAILLGHHTFVALHVPSISISSTIASSHNERLSNIGCQLGSVGISLLLWGSDSAKISIS
jgi:hypothetical protein